MSKKLNIENVTTANKFYRKVIHTTKEMQLVVMNLKPKEEIGAEVHPSTTQFIRVEEGNGTAIIGKTKYPLKPGDSVMIKNKTRHNIIAGSKGLQIYTLYSPPEHDKNCKQKTKKQAEC